MTSSRKAVSVFISHSSNDDEFVTSLSRDLRRNAIDVWIDDTRIQPGDDFIAKIDDGLMRATHVIIVLSPNSALSDWVREETHAAQIQAIRGSMRLIPILVNGFAPERIPSLLQSRLYVDFNTPSDYQNALRRLLLAFKDDDTLESYNEERLHPRIEELNVLTHTDKPRMGLEMLVSNSSAYPILLREAKLRSEIELNINYDIKPPIYTHRLLLDVTPPTVNNKRIVSGSAGAEGDPWTRKISGIITDDGYGFIIKVAFPFYVELAPLCRVLLRFEFDHITYKDRCVEEVQENALSLLVPPPVTQTEMSVDLDWPEDIPVLPPPVGYPTGFSHILLRTDGDQSIAAMTEDAFLFHMIANEDLPDRLAHFWRHQGRNES